MRNTFYLFIIFSIQCTFAQQNEINFYSLEVNYFYGDILEHNQGIEHLITGHPTGIIASINRKTYGFNEWESRYNFPDWGLTFVHQDLKNEFLGENYSLLGHFNFYLLNRSLTIGIGQGISYATNPYDSETNYTNNAYGTRLLATTLFRVNYTKENIIKGIGLQAGIGLIHYSNGNFKAPNSSTNTLFGNVGVSYLINNINFPARIPHGAWRSSNYAERIKYNMVFRTGVNEADVNGLGQHPFYTVSVFADKRINYKSSFQVGADVFFADFLIDLMRYEAIAFPDRGVTGDEDYRRIGVFVGHELRLNQLAFVSQVGKYVYREYEFENSTYNRLGLKRYFYEDRIFVALTLKAHFAKAEAIEFGLGVRI